MTDEYVLSLSRNASRLAGRKEAVAVVRGLGFFCGVADVEMESIMRSNFLFLDSSAYMKVSLFVVSLMLKKA